MKELNQKIMTFLMFEGKAEEAMNFYTSLFDHSEIISIKRYGANEEEYLKGVSCRLLFHYMDKFLCV